MLKKAWASLLAVIFILTIAPMNTSANEAFLDALEEDLKATHYDYKEGTAEIVKEETLRHSNGNEVIAAVVKLDTIRDGIFITRKTELHYYDATDNKILSTADLAEVEGAGDFADANIDMLGQKVVYWLPVLILLLLIAIPAIILYVVVPRFYSTSSYMNPVYEKNDNPR
ncbi:MULTISPECIES: hypothetical protein [unclassified Exiguobacterium]|uniref:hypothetical protein n=1 Tax=unclassified Exiguobacterium TaxID=2644629 RepID=UPI0020374F48|nr:MULTISPECIES: hypothetical protein [unclassified Exiguobacterium]